METIWYHIVFYVLYNKANAKIGLLFFLPIGLMTAKHAFFIIAWSCAGAFAPRERRSDRRRPLESAERHRDPILHERRRIARGRAPADAPAAIRR